MINAVVLISGNGTNLQAIIDKCHGVTVNIAAVISDQGDAFGLKRASNVRIPGIIAHQESNETRWSYCEKLGDLVAQYKPDLIILAGFMKILAPNFVKRFQNQIINIHPSLLPKHRGLNTHQRVLDSGDKEHGITIHLVSEALDAGPILLQKSYQFYKHASAEDLEKRIHEMEHEWYPEVINLLARWQSAINRG